MSTKEVSKLKKNEFHSEEFGLCKKRRKSFEPSNTENGKLF
jgi:hypothetical protein